MDLILTSDLEKLPHRYQVLFAIFCAEQVIHLVRPEHKEVCLKAVDAAKGFTRGEASREECHKAADTAYSAAAYTANAAAYIAANAAYTAAYAAWAADATYSAAYYAADAVKNKKKVIQQQWNYYHELLNLDENIEKTFLEN